MDLVYLIFRSNDISQHPGQHRGQSKIVCGTKGQGIGKICDYSKSLGQGKAEIQPRKPPKKGSVSRGALGDGVITNQRRITILKVYVNVGLLVYNFEKRYKK